MEIEGKVIAIVGSGVKTKIHVNKEVYVFDSIPKYTRKEKILEALKMVNLSDEYILRKSNDLSNVEYNKLLLARDLITGSKVIYLDYFDKGMCYKEKEYFKKLIRKLSRMYNITFLILTNDFSFCLNLVDEFHIFKNGRPERIVSKKEVYKEKIYEYYNKHELVDLVIKSRKFKHLRNDYFELSDVLKAIYRELK